MHQTGAASRNNSEISKTSLKVRFLYYLLPPALIISCLMTFFVIAMGRNIIIEDGKKRLNAIVESNSFELKAAIIARDFTQAGQILQRFLDNKEVIAVALINPEGNKVSGFKSDQNGPFVTATHKIVISAQPGKNEIWAVELILAQSSLNRYVDIFVLSVISVFLFMTLGFVIGLFTGIDALILPVLRQLKDALNRDGMIEHPPQLSESADELGEVVVAFNRHMQQRLIEHRRLQACIEKFSGLFFSYDISGDHFLFNHDHFPDSEIKTENLNSFKKISEILPSQQRSELKQFLTELKEDFNSKITGDSSLLISLEDRGHEQKRLWFRLLFCWDRNSAENRCDGLLANVTAEKTCQISLKKNAGDYRTMLENLPVGIWRSRGDNLVMVNPQFSHMLGYPSPDFLISSVRSVAHEMFLRPEDHTFLLDELKKKQVVNGLEFRLKRADSTIFTAAVFARLVVAEEGFTVEGALIDISVSREVQESLRQKQEMLNAAINAGKVIAYKINLIDGQMQLCGSLDHQYSENLNRINNQKDLQKMVHPDDLALFPPKFDATRKGGEDPSSGVLNQDFRLCLTGQGAEIETRWFRAIYAFSEFSHYDRPRFQHGLLIDITSIKYLLETLERGKAKAEESCRRKSEFFANISHEIRTPLNAIVGFSELLLPVLKNTGEEGYINSIVTAGRNLLDIVNDVLDFSRLDSGKLEILPEPLSIEVLARETTQLFRGHAEAKRLNFVVEVDDSVPSILLVDGIRVRQVLNNLVSNALKFTESGRICVNFSASPAREKGKTDLIISVEDSGVGISHSDQQDIFQPFLQKKGQGGKMGGTGLGLAICKKLVEMMDGEMFVKSEPGKGSRFEVRLRNITIEKLTSHLLPDSASRARLFHFEKQRVLVVDDATSNRELLFEALSAVGLEVRAARDGQEAVDIAEEFDPALVIMDIRMPVKDGVQATIEIKARKNIPVIALTASVSSVEPDCREIFDGYLHKPVKLYDLFSEGGRFLKFSLKDSEVKFTQEPEASPAVAFEQIIEPKSLVDKIDEKLIDELESFSGVISIDEIMDFAARIRAMATQHCFNLLALEAEELLQHAGSFDVKGMQKSIRKMKATLQQFLGFFKSRG